MSRVFIPALVATTFLSAVGWAQAATVGGGGSSKTDCVLVLEIPGANKPAPPKTPRAVDCTDGDPACDSDGLRNGECVFPLQLCANSTSPSFPKCVRESVDSIVVDHAIDDGSDPRFDNDFLALQSRANGLGLPSFSDDDCTLSSAITVRLRGPDSKSRMKPQKKRLKVTALGVADSKEARDIDKVKFTCRPEGDGIYLPVDLYVGTFDRIARQVFQQSCATSGCHDSESHAGDLILLPGAAYANIVGVTPTNVTAAGDMLDRVAPGDENASFLYLKVAGILSAGHGARMPFGQAPLSPDLVEIIRLWILGDGMLGAAPETGWVAGTDQ